MKAFVTGASGFLGSTLVDLLLESGHEVVCLLRPTSSRRWLKGKQIKIIQGKLKSEPQEWHQELKDVDWFFHVAGLLSASRKEDYYQVNAKGTKACLDACRDFAPNLQRFVFVSSQAACGPAFDGSYVTEETKPCPISDYGKSKLAGEAIVRTYMDKLPISVIRPPAIYGERDQALLPVFSFAKRGLFLLPGHRKRIISMAHVKDVARACLWSAEEEHAKGETYFVADGEQYPWEQVAEVLSNVMHQKVRRVRIPKTVMSFAARLEAKRSQRRHRAPRIHQGHVDQFYQPSWAISIDKIRKAGFKPKYDLQTGMAETIKGYQKLGWL